MTVSVTDAPKVGGTTWDSGDAPGTSFNYAASADTFSAAYSGAVAAARPTSVDTQAVTALRLNALNRKLQVESTVDDIFVDIGADVVFTGKKVAIPDACIIRLKSDTKGEHSVTIPMVQPLSGPGRGGTTEAQQGYERQLTLKYMQAFYNEYSQAVVGEAWGVNANEVEVFNLYSNIQPMLSKWFKEDTGMQFRQALVQTFAWPLTKPGSVNSTTGKTSHWNPNWFIPNTAMATSAAIYNADLSTMTAALAAAFAAADTGTNGANANCSLEYLIALDHYAQNTKRIAPLTIGGKKTYIVCLPSTQYKKIIQVTTGELGSIWQNVSALTSEEQNFPGVVGRVLSLLIVEDQRTPTITFDDYDVNETHVVTVEYVQPGNVDNRNKTIYDASSNKAWDIGYLMGAGAIIDWEVTPIHFEMEKTEYGKKYGKGAFCERGIQLARFQSDSAVYANFGSILLPFTTTSLITVA
jgi:hypothetical protein